MYFQSIASLNTREIFPGYIGRFVHTDKQTFAFWDVIAGSSVPEHQHPHEQIVTVREGQFALTVNGETKVMDKGMVAVIPGNTPHAGIAVTDCQLLDIFYPIREDYK